MAVEKEVLEEALAIVPQWQTATLAASPCLWASSSKFACTCASKPGRASCAAPSTMKVQKSHCPRLPHSRTLERFNRGQTRSEGDSSAGHCQGLACGGGLAHGLIMPWLLTCADLLRPSTPLCFWAGEWKGNLGFSRHCGGFQDDGVGHVGDQALMPNRLRAWQVVAGVLTHQPPH